ncbi:MAG: hypothetical protein GWN32_01060 [Gemmatimonadetes bacterium]|nr:hypothetical protein [Gemmatimonadota bacterium]
MGRFIAFVLVLAVGLVAGYYYRSVSGPTYRHHITVGVTGGVATSITVIPDPVTARLGDTLSWVHPAADSFDIQLDDTVATTATVRGYAGRQATTTVRLDAPIDTFKYDVIVWIGGVADTLDPRVVTKEEEGES